jgi:hypothetical protein
MSSFARWHEQTEVKHGETCKKGWIVADQAVFAVQVSQDAHTEEPDPADADTDDEQQQQEYVGADDNDPLSLGPKQPPPARRRKRCKKCTAQAPNSRAVGNLNRVSCFLFYFLQLHLINTWTVGKYLEGLPGPAYNKGQHNKYTVLLTQSLEEDTTGTLHQGFRSGLDPDSVALWIRIRIGNPDPDPEARK